MLSPLYQYNAIVTKVYDGDTVTVDIDLGLGIWAKGVKLRLKGIDAPEVRGDSRPAGLDSRDALRQMILGRQVLVETHQDKKGKYGRYLGVIFFTKEDDDEVYEVTEELVKAGLAVEREY